MKTRVRFAVCSIFLAVLLFVVPAVSAHPLGNFTINHFSKLSFSAGQVSIEFVLDMAEIPAFQEISLLDTNQNGAADPGELTGYPQKQCGAIMNQVRLQKNGLALDLSLARSGVAFPPGAAGLATLRLTCTFQNASVRWSDQDRIDYADNSYSERIGWREIVVVPSGIHLQGQYTASSISHELTAYPQDMLASPLDVRQVSLTVGTVANPAQPAQSVQPGGATTALWANGPRSDQFTQLITLQDTSPLSILLALLVAFVWGGLHALTPGHGKTIVGAYLVGSRGTARHAVALGLMTTLTHTAGVFLLGLVTLFASRYILPEQVLPYISILSGLLVVTIGISLFLGRLIRSRAWASLVQRYRKTSPENHPVALDIPPQPLYPLARPDRVTQLVEIHALPQRSHTVSLVSAEPGHFHLAQASEAHVHTHADGSTHSHANHTHSHGIEMHTHPHSDGASHSHSDHGYAQDGEIHPHQHSGWGHSHDPSQPGGHTHLPPDLPNAKVTWRSLLALGISGGLLPCPSALVVMLGAIALDRIGFGVVLVLAFSLGLAGVLSGIGLSLVYARRFFERIPIHSRFSELIPAGSALFITVLGAGITLQALAQLGWIQL